MIACLHNDQKKVKPQQAEMPSFLSHALSAFVFIVFRKAPLFCLELIYGEKLYLCAGPADFLICWAEKSLAPYDSPRRRCHHHQRLYACKWQNRSRLRELSYLLIYLFIYWPRRHIALMRMCARRDCDQHIHLYLHRKLRRVPQRKSGR